jgi:uncharacterized protein YjbI with pentapeptide repeats
MRVSAHERGPFVRGQIGLRAVRRSGSDKLTTTVALLAGCVIVTTAIAAIVFLPRWIIEHDVAGLTPIQRVNAIGSARTAVLALLAGMIAVVGAYYTSRSYRLNRRGQATDRYTRAIDQLGHQKADVQLGGIYGLERLADESPEDAPQIIEVLSAFIREHSPATPIVDDERGDERELRRPGAEVIAAFRVLSRRSKAAPGERPVDLSAATLELVHMNAVSLPGAVLRHAQLVRANLPNADLAGADLSGAVITFAKLRNANLADAALVNAGLYGVDLSGANLQRAKLDEANLRKANLTGADLDSAVLENAFLGEAIAPSLQAPHADLTQVDLRSANLENANLAHADLSRAKLSDANLCGASLGGATLQRADLSGADLTDADITGADLARASMAGAVLRGLTGLESAIMPNGWQSKVAEQPDGTRGDLVTGEDGSAPAAAS